MECNSVNVKIGGKNFQIAKGEKQMDKLVYLCYPILIVIFLWGAKLCKKGEFNEEFMSITQTKYLQGFFAIIIMLHHIGQKTCAPWLNPAYIVHGLGFDCGTPII